MTAIIGYCLSDGAYLAADSLRTEDTGEQSNVKKIKILKAGMVIATGGLGTEGDNTKKKMIDLVQKEEMALGEIIENAKKISSFEFSTSFKKKSGHEYSLTCIIAGKDDHGKGFICALSSHRNFEPYRIGTIGQPYFTGSNTKLVQCISNGVIRRLQATDEKLKFDKWAIESIKKIRSIDQNVGFPLQIACAKQDVHAMHNVNEFYYTYRHEFETEFPPL